MRVLLHALAGPNAHNARLVAAMAVHGLTHLLTSNDQDFRRFAGITALTPGRGARGPADDVAVRSPSRPG